jgi:protein SCO1/2
MRGLLPAVLIVGSFGMGVWRASVERKLPVLPFYADSTLTPAWTNDTARVHRVESFALVDQRGRPVSELDLSGKITVVTFFYATCKDICPRLQSRLATVRAAFANDSRVQLASISVAPEHDTAPILAAYAEANRIEAPSWLLLTGARAEIDRVAAKSFFATQPMLRASSATHGETIWLLDGSRRIRGLYNGSLPMDAERLKEDIATLTATRGD